MRNTAIATIVTANYIAQALTLYSYCRETNPESRFIVVIIGERTNLNHPLPDGPEWIWWQDLVDEPTRERLTREYTAFELACVMRGRVHQFLASAADVSKWVVIDSDTAILANLKSIWQALEQADIALTPHATKPIDKDYAMPLEGSILRFGIFNGGVLAMKKSETARQAAAWLIEKLEHYGHSYAHRQTMGLANHQPFEFVDQIWLNLLFMYFNPSVVMLKQERCNLGHWNLHQGKLEIDQNGAHFNGDRVLVAHFSGLPTDNLGNVSKYSDMYRQAPLTEWEILAKEYLRRVDLCKRVIGDLEYCYTSLQPNEPERGNVSHDQYREALQQAEEAVKKAEEAMQREQIVQQELSVAQRQLMLNKDNLDKVMNEYKAINENLLRMRQKKEVRDKQISSAVSKLRQKQAVLLMLKAEISRLNDNLRSRDQAVDELTMKIISLHRSKSWRITGLIRKPLDKLRHLNLHFTRPDKASISDQEPDSSADREHFNEQSDYRQEHHHDNVLANPSLQQFINHRFRVEHDKGVNASQRSPLQRFGHRLSGEP